MTTPIHAHAATQAAPAPSDADLVAATRRGDAGSFELIMRRHNRLLYRTARGIVSNDAHAQDVVQETYMRAFTRLDSFQGHSELKTWLVRIAINAALDLMRREGRIVQIDDTEHSALDPNLEQTMTALSSNDAAPDAALARGQMRDLLQWAIEQLPPKYRSVFMLRAVEELSVEETARCLALTTDVVKTRYLRARAMLRDALGAKLEAHTHRIYEFDGAACDAVVAHVISNLRQMGVIRQ